MNAIEVKNISKSFKIPHIKRNSLSEFLANPFKQVAVDTFCVLNKVNFAIKKGETVGIIGPNGSGKSTLLKNLIGILDLSFGTILINGNQVTELREIWGNIGYMDQNTIVFPGMNIRDNLQFGLHKISE